MKKDIDGDEPIQEEFATPRWAAVAFSVEPVEPPESVRRALLDRISREPGAGTRFREARFRVKPGVSGTRSGLLEWSPTPIPGLEEKVIARDEERSVTTRLIRFAAGARYPNHRHGGTEEIFVLEGSVSVNDVLLSAGDYCRSEAGTEEIGTVSPTGGLAIVISSDRDEVDISPGTP